MRENVILVDDSGKMTGVMEKIEAHEKGLLHSALSVFIFNSKGQLLLQKRALNKYHSAGLWTNSCCSHPRPDESPAAAAKRRLKEEMEISAELTELFEFTYRHVFDNGLTEHEYDHVFAGLSDQIPNPDPEEVAAYRYAAPDELIEDISKNPASYTVWFKLVLGRVLQQCQTINFATK